MQLYKITLLALLVFLCSCQDSKTKEKSKTSISETETIPPQENLKKDTTLTEDKVEFVEDFSEYEDFYIVITDTSKNYPALRSKMFEINQLSGIEIDTLGRFYDPIKKKICFQETEEEIDNPYIGDYFPRRFPNESLSIEHYDFYNEKADSTTLSIVIAIYEDAFKADSLEYELKKKKIPSFIIKSAIYTGCTL